MFPETYPEVLKNVSFNINENIGILNNWNKYCKTSKENPYFVYTVLKNSVNKNYFPDDQILPTSVLNLVNYISSCITVKWIEDEFLINFKKIKDKNEKLEKSHKKSFILGKMQLKKLNFTPENIEKQLVSFAVWENLLKIL